MPECIVKLFIPIGVILGHDLFEDGLQYFICGLGQAVRLRIVWHAFLMYNRVVQGELADNVVEKMSTLITDELNRASKTAP